MREILPFYKSPYLSYVVVEAEEMAEGLDPIAARSVALKELQKKITCAVCRRSLSAGPVAFLQPLESAINC